MEPTNEASEPACLVLVANWQCLGSLAGWLIELVMD